MLPDKGTNDTRVPITDLAKKVLLVNLSKRSDASQTSLIKEVLDDWAMRFVISALRQRDEANLLVEQLENQGIDTALIRQEYGERLLKEQKG